MALMSLLARNRLRRFSSRSTSSKSARAAWAAYVASSPAIRSSKVVAIA